MNYNILGKFPRIWRVDGICGSGQSGTVKNGGVENTGVDILARCGNGGQCRSGQLGTMLQGWTLQEWTNQHDVAIGVLLGVLGGAAAPPSCRKCRKFLGCRKF